MRALYFSKKKLESPFSGYYDGYHAKYAQIPLADIRGMRIVEV